MKKIIFLAFLTTSSLLFAQTQQDEIKKVTTVETSNEFILAQTQYKIGNHLRSYNQFKKLFLNYTDNEQVNFYLGMSAVKLKLYDEATAAFERVLIVNPMFHRARLEYARVLYIIGFKEQAKKEFVHVAQYPIPKNVRKNIELYLKKIDNEDNKDSTFIALGFGYMYDDNINSGIEYDSYNLPGLSNLSVTADKPQSSTAYTTSLQLNHIHSFDKIPLAIKHTATYFYKNQTTNNKYNFTYFAYKPTIYYNDVKHNTEYSVELGLEKIYPGDDTDFASYSLSPKAKKLIDKNTIVSAYLGYREFHYEHLSDKNKAYSKKTLGSSLKYKNFTYTLEFQKDTKEHGTRTDLDKNIISNTFAYKYDIQESLFLNFRFQHKQAKYKNKDTYFDNNRIDNTNIYNIGLIKIIDKKDFASISYTKTNNNTNQTAYEYKKDSVYLSYTWRFKL